MTLKKENILIVDDDYDMLELLQRQLKEQNYHSYKAAGVNEAISLLKSNSIDLIITDLQMPGINGLELIKYVSDHFPDIPKLVITGYPSIDGALDSMKSGALDYLIKPFTKNELKSAIKNSMANAPKKRLVQSGNSHGYSYAGIIGKSIKIKEMIDIIERVKNNKATILIEGESGTGKELVARAIHYKGSFAANPFITVNCGAIPEELLEAELFGYKKGSFTGANENRIGFFQAADKGTIFLDEIGTASPAVQIRLLRVLQEKEVRKIGEQKTQKVDLRVIAATNNDLKKLVEQGTFREDLYYRLNVVNIHTPPLRKRPDDILMIAEHFVKKYGKEFGKSNIKLSPKTGEIFKKYLWPGNVRELENIVQRSIIMSDEYIEPMNLPDNMKYQINEIKTPTTFMSLKEMEKQHILNVLKAVDYNKTKAAEILQINRKTLRSKLE